MQQGRVRGRVRRGGAVLAVGVLALAMGAYRWDGRHDGSAGGEVDPSWASEGAPAVLGAPASEVASALQAHLAAAPTGVNGERWARVQRLYADGEGAPLWLRPAGLDAERVDALLRALDEAQDEGLDVDAYPRDALVAATEAVRGARHPSADQLAAADVLLTTAYVSLATDLIAGQIDPKGLSQGWHIPRASDPVDSLVAAGLREPRLDSALARMRPEGEGYAVLREALGRYRTIVAAGGWPTVPEGRKLRPGQSDSPARLAALRERLRAEGYGAATGGEDATARRGVYDRALAGLVAEFQARHGMEPDSVLGERTLRALNVPASFRLGQIAANLERLRWLPRSLGERYVLVNLPAFRLQAHAPEGSLEMKVIVGETGDGKRTPVFGDSLEMVVFRPYWNITPDIQAEETAPRIRANPGYMAANDLEYYRDGGETRIRQRPGPSNALGLVKFLFPNQFNVYLHDTPNDELFAKDVRTFSHGCIRLERPAELAEWVLGWDAAQVDEAMYGGRDDRTVRVPRKIPVYIVYATAYGRDGALHFGSDIYDRDEALVAAVAGGAAPR